MKSAVKNSNGIKTLVPNLYIVFSKNNWSSGTFEHIIIEDITRILTYFLSVIDTTGIANVVSQYSYPKCSKYFD